MKLLYVAAGHGQQCADDVLMWDKLDIDWFSTCYYLDTDQPGILPEVKRRLNADEFFRHEFAQCKSWTSEPPILVKKNKDHGGTSIKNFFAFKKRFLQMFDAILIGHNARNLEDVLKYVDPKKTLVAFKTFGMHSDSVEKKMISFKKRGVVLIRNSPKEHLLYSKFAGYDAIIRGSVVKDEHEISGWNGDTNQVVTLVNGIYCPYIHAAQKRRQYYLHIRNKLPDLPFICHGSENSRDPKNISGGFISHQEKISLLQNSRVNLVLGTPHANNTYSMVESWVMGMPTVVFGRKLWPGVAYEPDELITHGEDGFIVNSIEEAVDVIQQLIDNKELAEKVGKLGREKAISIYGRDVLAQQWADFFKKYL